MKSTGSVYLCDVSTVQDNESGERYKVITGIVEVNCERSTVGMQTFWNATANNIRLDRTFILRARIYKNQKYVYDNGDIYTVQNIAKSKFLSDIQLNCSLEEDDSLKELIQNALGTIKNS